MGGRVVRDLRQPRRDPAQGPPDSAANLPVGEGRQTPSAQGHHRSDGAMKLFTGWMISAGLVDMATAANAQALAPYQVGDSRYSAVSDVDGPYVGGPYVRGPYGAMPPGPPGP